jgi:hypothetical protein
MELCKKNLWDTHSIHPLFLGALDVYDIVLFYGTARSLSGTKSAYPDIRARRQQKIENGAYTRNYVDDHK